MAPKQPVRSVPAAADLLGAWRSFEMRGALEDFGHFALYVFGPDGVYSGALANDEASTPIEGRYTYADGALTLDDGALRFKVTRVDGDLELVSAGSYLRLTRAAATPDRSGNP